MVEFWPDGTIYPVEYKHGPRKQRENDDLQLAAQAVCLSEMFKVPVERGAIFHAASKRRREIVISEEISSLLAGTVAAIRTMLGKIALPPPVNDHRCPQCSLREICQPQSTSKRSEMEEMRKQLFLSDG